MQRALRKNSPHLSYAEVLKKQSTSLDKQPSQTLPQKTSTNNVKVSPDHSQENVHNSAPTSTQIDGNKRVWLENKKKYSGKVESNTHSHIPTSKHFQLLQHLSTDLHTVWDSVYTDSIGQSTCKPPFQPKIGKVTDRVQKSRLPKFSQTNLPNEQSRVVHQLTTASMSIFDLQENSVHLGNKNKTGLIIPRGIDISLVSCDNPFSVQDNLPSQVNYGIAKQTDANSCHKTHDPNSLDTLNQHIPDYVFADRHKCIEYCVQQNGKDFGFIPLTTLKVYCGDPMINFPTSLWRISLFDKLAFPTS